MTETAPPLTFREMDLVIFQGRDPGGVLWQPRIDFWYRVNKTRGTLPAHLRDAELLDVYDYCHASVRYFGRALCSRYKTVRYREERPDERSVRRIWETPVGTISDVLRADEWGLSHYQTEYRIKTPADLAVLEYMLQDEEWYWDQKAYEADLERVGDRGAQQFYFRRSPLQGLFIENMGFERTIYLLHDQPEVIHRYLAAQAQADDALYDVVCACPVQILNFGENIDAHMDPPTLWMKYHIPYYRQRTAQLREAGKYVHIHIDGAMRPLLPYLQECPWDGIEAATPLPQGDVTLEEIKTALGDLVLLDGIPAVYFLSYFSEAVLRECVDRLVELFYPRLVLGISDEIPPDGDIERVKRVGEWVRAMA